MIRVILFLLGCLSQPLDAGNLANGEVVHVLVNTRKFCNLDLMDVNSQPYDCSKSQAEETRGMTLPWVKDGTIASRSDILITEEGQVKVTAMANRPYQYIMFIEKPYSTKVLQLYNHRAFEVTEIQHSSRRARGLSETPKSLDESGWTRESREMLDGVEYNKWVKDIPAEEGANYTAISMSGIMPSYWVCLADDDDRPVATFARNSFVGDKTFQESKYEIVDDEIQRMSLEEGISVMFDTYEIDRSRRFGPAKKGEAPSVDPDHVFDDMFNENDPALILEEVSRDWRRGSGNIRSRRGIEYFTIQAKSTDNDFFQAQYRKHDRSRRELATVFNFVLPQGCSDANAKTGSAFCLFTSLDTFALSYSLKSGFRFVDVKTPNRVAKLALQVIMKQEDLTIENFKLAATGCATVFQLGEGVSVSIDICVEGRVDFSSNTTFAFDVSLKVIFSLNLPLLPEFISLTVLGRVEGAAKPKNEIYLKGTLAANLDALVFGAGASLDMTGTTVENKSNKWHFLSGVDLTTWVNLGFWGDTWGTRFELWEAGPMEL